MIRSASDLTRNDRGLALAAALVISLVIGAGFLREVWFTGAFFDTDDATRMVQVRDWMAGQPWYDLHMARLGLPGAPPMHWTRIVDVPVAALVRALSLFLDAAPAERAARIAFPLLLCAALFWTACGIATRLVGPEAMLPGSILIALTGLTLWQCQPGRIDHHAPQIVLLSLAGLFLLDTIGPGRGFRSGFLCASSFALSLAISLENLPASATIGAMFPLLWVARGKAQRAALAGFGAGLLIATPALCALTVAPARWFAPACDAQSFPYVAVTAAGGLACIALAWIARPFASVRARLVGAAIAGCAPLSLAVVLLRTCAIDPYDGIDPLVRALWLGTVQEAFSLSDAWAHGMQGNVLALLAPAAVGLIGMAIAIARTQGEARLRWVAWTALSACTLLVASLRIGYGQTALVTTAFGALALIDMIPAQRRALRLPCAVALSPLALAALLPERAASPPTSGAIAACNRPDDARGLAALPPGLVLAPIDQGAFVLAFTPHRALAAPYHRNNAGNRLALEALREPAEDALALLRAAGVDYVAACGEAGARTPLLVALDGPSPPARVARVDAPGAYRVWRIDP